MRFWCVLLLAATAFADPRYLKDFEFIRDTVKQHGAAVKSKKIDWKRACARLRPAFANCDNDLDHVRNCMRLLAVLRDSHTGVTNHRVKGAPSKWDGLYGGGLWIGWDRGAMWVQGLMEGHALAGVVPLGSAIVSIEGEPAWLAMERERRRITEFQGASTDHSLFCSLDNRFLPFGDKREITVEFLTPEGRTKKSRVARWGPGGKAFRPGESTLPAGLGWKKGAVAKMLDSKVGYLRITGGMDDATVAAFHQAFDTLRGMEALLLDCRRMGGGSDDAAWAMAGRFFPKGVSNGLHGRITPSGRWQFEGPVVMLQDELEVSSAETFTWAMSETKRCVSVGRSTGGWGIIPRGYSCPSGILSFRLGVNDRPTPITRVHTEGIGWPPDIEVPYGPLLCAKPDLVRELGTKVLARLRAGISRNKVISRFLEDEKLVKRDLKARLAMELELAKTDALGVSNRLESLNARGKSLGIKTTRLAKEVRKQKAEIGAQKEFLEFADEQLQLDDAARKRYLAGHGRTRFAKAHVR